MPVEFALRPRIRLREDFAPPRRARFHLPRFTFQVLGYWLAIAGATYAFIRSADATRESARALADSPAPEPEATPPQDWWKPIAAPAALPPAALEPAPLPTPEPTPAAAPPPEPEPEPESPLAALAPEPDARSAPEARQRAAFPAARRTTERSERFELAAPALPAPLPPPTEAPPVASIAPVDRAPATSGGGVPSCEAAIASASQDIDFAHADRTADLPSSALAAVLENGAWLSDCNVPESTSLEVCVAIKNGRVVGATVAARPSNGSVAACVRKRATGLHFPYSSHLDIARTRF